MPLLSMLTIVPAFMSVTAIISRSFYFAFFPAPAHLPGCLAVGIEPPVSRNNGGQWRLFASEALAAKKKTNLVY